MYSKLGNSVSQTVEIISLKIYTSKFTVKLNQNLINFTNKLREDFWPWSCRKAIKHTN